MFGNKGEKAERLEREANLIEEQEITPTQLANQVGVPPKTIYKDLVDLEENGVLLQEHNGKLSVFRRR